MASVIHRTTLEVLHSVNTPDYPTVQWIHNPNLTGVLGVLKRYWKIVGDLVQEMSPAEKGAVDASLLPEDRAAKLRVFDLRTQEILAAGVEHPAGSGHFYCITPSNIQALMLQRAVGIYPFLVHSIGFTSVIQVANSTQADNIIGVAQTRMREVMQDGAALLELLRAATTKTELDAVVDPR